MAMAMANVNLNESRGPDMIGAIVSTYCVAIAVVALRIFARRVGKVRLWIDDYLILVGMALYTVVVALFLRTIALGTGRHIQAIDPSVFKNIEILFFITEFTFCWAIGFVKCSVLAFYWRIFSSASSIRKLIWIITAIVIAWVIGFTLISVLQCTPPKKLWIPSTPGTCRSKFAIFLGGSIPEVVTDFMILVLPMPYIWRLHLKTKQKVLLTGVFLLGGFACVSSIVRTWSFVVRDYNSTDLSWTTADSAIWSCVELAIAIISACLPSLRSIITYLRTGSGVRISSTGETAGAHLASEKLEKISTGKSACSKPISLTDTQIRGYSFEEALYRADEDALFLTEGRLRPWDDRSESLGRVSTRDVRNPATYEVLGSNRREVKPVHDFTWR